MANKHVSRSVLFYKRMIAAILALLILTLTGLSIFLGVTLHRVNGELDEARDLLLTAQLKEAEAEAERLKNLIPPEQMKPMGEAVAPDILANNTIIAHALGTVDGEEGLNCLEGFEASYAAGIRVFETDLRMTADGYVVLRHDWTKKLQEGVDPAHIPTLEEFMAKPILGKYTPLSFRDLLLLMVRYPDVCIITDTKITDAEAAAAQFRAMLEEAHKLGLSYLFDRMIVQVYSPEHFSAVNGVNHFPYYIYTLYQEAFDKTEEAFRRKAIFCQENGIMGIAMWDSWWDPDYAPIADWRDVKVYAHTVNDTQKAKSLLRSGIRAVYTDTITPADMEG